MSFESTGKLRKTQNKDGFEATEKFSRNEELLRKRYESKASYTASSLNSRIKKMYDDYNAEAEERNKFVNGEDGYYSKLQAPGLQVTGEGFKKRAEDIKSYIEKNRQYLSDEGYKSAVDDLQKFIDTDSSEKDKAFSDYYNTVSGYGGKENYDNKAKEYEFYKKFGIDENTTYDDIAKILYPDISGAAYKPISGENPLIISSDERKKLQELLHSERIVNTMSTEQIKNMAEASDATGRNFIYDYRGVEPTAYYYKDDSGNVSAMKWENLYKQRSLQEKTAKASEYTFELGGETYTAAELYDYLADMEGTYSIGETVSPGDLYAAVEGGKENVKLNKYQKLSNYFDSQIGKDKLAQTVVDEREALKREIEEKSGINYNEYVKFQKYNIDKEKSKLETEAYEAIAQELPSILTIPASTGFALLGIGEYAGNAVASVGEAIRGEETMLNTYDDNSSNISDAIAQGGYEGTRQWWIDRGYSEKTADNIAFVRQAVQSGFTSIAVTTLSTAMFGPEAAPVVTGAVMGSMSAESSMKEAAANGSTTEEALLTGLFAGIAESIGEAVSLDLIFGKFLQHSIDASTFKSLMKGIGKKAVDALGASAIEGSEEIFTDFLNTIADNAVNGDHSSYQLNVEKYIMDGYSRGEAEQKAAKDYMIQCAKDGIAGAIGGFMMGGSIAGVQIGGGVAEYTGNNIRQNRANEFLGRVNLDNEGDNGKTGAENITKYLEEVLAEDSPYREDPELIKLAEKVKKLSDEGKLSSKNKAASRAAGEFLARAEAFIGDYNARIDEKNAVGERTGANEKAVQGEGTAESAAANSQQEKYIAPAGRDSSRVSIDDGNIIYVSGKQGGESESMDLAISLALTSAAEARDAFGIISPRAVQEIGDAYTGDISGVEEYAEQALMAYALGYMGNSLEDTVATVSNMVSGARQTAWEQGVKDADAFYNERDAEIRSAAAEAQKPGVFTNRRGNTDTSEIQHLIDNKALSEEQTRFIDVVRKLSEVFGLDFELYASEVDENGQRHGDAGYIDDSGKIHIDIFAGQEKSAFIARDSTLTSTLLHELTHFIHDWSPKAWKEMYNYVVARYSPYGSVQAALEAIRAREKLEGREISDDLAQDEFMAQCCEALFEDEAGMRDFAAKHKNTAQKIVEWLENLLEKISGINIGHSESDIAAVISQWQDGIEELREKWLAALEDAANNKNAADRVLKENANAQAEVRKARGIRDEKAVAKATGLEGPRTEYSVRNKTVNDTVDKAIKQKGNIDEKYNQKRISEFPDDITALVSKASDGRIDLSQKYVAINGSDVWHEYQRRTNISDEIGRRQVAFTDDTMKEAIMAIYSPEIVESVFSTGRNPTQRQSFAYAKKSDDGHYIVVEAVGGKRSQNVVPVMILQFNEEKWNEMISQGKTLGEVLYENDTQKREALDVDFNKKNRVTVAQFASKEAIANTPRSPRFNNTITQPEVSVKPETEKNSSTESDNKRSSRSKRDEKSAAAAEAEAKAGEIAKKWGLSEKKTEALGRGLTNIFESVSGAEVDMEFVRQQAASLAAKTANGMISPDMPADISDKLSFLRSFGAVSLTVEQRNAAAKLAGTFKEYRSRISSAVKINEKGEDLSTAWDKLSKQMPELFPADTAESDMARVMLQNVSRLLADERAYRMEGFELAEARESLRREIYDAANQYIQYNRVTSGQTEVKLKNVVPRPSVRAVLAEAALKTAKTEEERAALREYKLNLETVNDMEAERDREYSKLLSMLPKSGFSTFTNEEIEAQRKVVEKLEKQISNADRVLKKSALAQPLQQLADREIKAVRKEGTEALAAMRERYKQRDVMDKLRRIMDRARKSVVNPNSKNYVLGRFVEPMEQLIKTVDPAPRMLNAWGETTKTFEEYDRNRRIALAKINEMKALMPEGTDKAPLSGEMQTAVDEANGTLDRISAMLNTRELGDMSSAELQNLYEMIRDVMNIMRSADRQVGVFEGKTHAEAGQELINEAERFINAKGNGKLSLFADYLNPMRLADVISQYDPNSYWAKYMKSLNEGRKKGAKWYMEADAPFDELRKRAKEYISFTRDIIDSGLRDTEGRSVKMTRSMIVSTVMLIEREMASNSIIHIEDPSGGLIIPDAKLMMKAKTKEDYTDLTNDHAQRVAFKYKAGSETEGMSEADIDLARVKSQKAWLAGMKATLEGKLTDYDRQWIEASREFFSKKSKDAINSTMLKIGKKVVATEAMYFPMRVSEDFVEVQLKGVKFDASMLANGVLKEITPAAKQPLVISGVEDVVKKHMDYVSKVYGLAVPLRDFKAAYNIKLPSRTQTATENNPDGEYMLSTSVRASLNRDATKKFRGVIEQLVTDLEAQRREVDDDRWYKILMSNFVASTLSGNISVTMKQAASYFTAGDVVSAKALAEALATRWGYYLGHCDEIYKEIDAHTAMHWERRRGMSIPELQQINKTLPRTVDKWNLPQGVRNKIDPTKWIQAADVGTTALIWEACKIDIKNQGVEVDTEEYWNKVTALYEKALEETQPMYDSLHRAQITKGTSPINKVLYMFKTQPLQNFGVMYSSVNRLNTYLDEYRAAKERGDAAAIKAAKEKVIAARNQLVRSTASQLSSLIVFTGMTLVAAAIRGKLDPWRDDDDELTPESIAKRFGIDMLSNAAANYIPFFWVQVAGIPAVKSIYNFFESGKKFSLDEIEISPLQTANDLLGDIADVVNNFADIEEKGLKSAMESVGYLALSVGDVFGLPATNLKNLFYGVYSNIRGFVKYGPDWQNEKDEYNTASGVKKALHAGKEEKAAERADAYIEGKVEAAMSDEDAEITEEQAREDAEKDLRSSVAGSYKEGYKASYIEAIFDEDETAAAEIEDTLEGLGIGFDESIFADWRQQAEDAMLEYDSYGDYVKGKGKLKYTVSGVKSAIDTGKTDDAQKRFKEAVDKKLRDIQKKDGKISSSKAKKQAETEVRNSVGSSYKAEWIKLMWQGYYEEADEIQRKLRKVSGVFDNEYFRGWSQKLKELKKEYSSYEEYEESK